MNSRIRYIKDSDGTMSGNKYYQAENGIEYSVSYVDHGDQCIGYVKGPSDIAEIKATSPHKIKIAIKKELEARGCVFEKETRSVSEA